MSKYAVMIVQTNENEINFIIMVKNKLILGIFSPEGVTIKMILTTKVKEQKKVKNDIYKVQLHYD